MPETQTKYDKVPPPKSPSVATEGDGKIGEILSGIKKLTESNNASKKLEKLNREFQCITGRKMF